MRKLAIVILTGSITVLGIGCSSNGSDSKVSLPEASAEPDNSDESPRTDDREATEMDETLAGDKTTPESGLKASGPRFSGSFEAQRETTVMPNVNGPVDRVRVEEGDFVQKGELLASIDAKDYELGVEQAKASVSAAKANVETLESEFGRMKELLEKDAVSESNFDKLKGQLEGARAQLSKAKIGLKQAKKARSDAYVSAPYSGTITRVGVSSGDYAIPGQVPLVTLVETNKLYLRTQVPEEYSGYVSEGAPVAVAIPAIEQTLTLEVDRINPVISEQSRAFDVLAELNNPDQPIRPGMFAEVTIGQKQGDDQ